MAAFDQALQRSGGGLLDGGRVHPAVSTQINAVRGAGAPLEPGVQAQMSQSFGHDFSDVRVHSDPLAGALAKSVQARAFTTGADIFFAGGEYRPGSANGRELLTHELAHVVQQRGAPTSGEFRVSDPGDALEREAERVSREIG
ncbi:MAG: DUF4157 domain-containing protein [Solirubrobacteraceae bacterium]|nr:DUF4157 domain-containing protein [Solirubrobacteraceae bacterium]